VNLSVDGYSNYHWDLPLLMFAQMQGLMGLLRQLMEVVKKLSITVMQLDPGYW
jgi:hypothetical protein